MESLEKHITSLSEIIEKEYNQYKRVYELVKNEQNILVNADLKRLEDNLREQQTIVNIINKLETQRLQELEIIGIYLGQSSKTLKISSIISMTAGPQAVRLSEIEKKFKLIIQEILKLNKSNEFLINRSMQFIDQHILVFFGALEDKGIYRPGVQSQQTPKTSCLVDRKV
jgi:hypothetical protein